MRDLDRSTAAAAGENAKNPDRKRGFDRADALGQNGVSVDMSDGADWDFANRDDAKAEIRAAVKYLLQNTSGAARADMVLELVQIVRDAANGIPARNPLDEGMPGG